MAVTRLAPQAAILFALWMLFSGTTNPYHVVLGLFCAFGVAWLNFGQPGSASTPFPPIRFLLYIPWLLSRVVAGGVHVAVLILNPRLPIDPQLIRHHVHLDDHRAVVLLGNSITLTPGTVTVEASSRELLVHAIDTDSSTDLRSGLLERNVAAVFQHRKGR